MKDHTRFALDPDVEVYRAYLATFEANLQRRFETNRHYFGIVSALFVAYGYLVRGDGALAPGTPSSVGGLSALAVQYGLPMLVMIVCAAWLGQLFTFRRISNTKFKVLGELEAKIALKPFSLEVTTGGRRRFLTGSFIDMVVPVALFGIAFVAFFAANNGPVARVLTDLIGK